MTTSTITTLGTKRDSHTPETPPTEWASQVEGVHERHGSDEITLDGDQQSPLHLSARVQPKMDGALHTSPSQGSPDREDQSTIATVERDFQFQRSFDRIVDKTPNSPSGASNKTNTPSTERLTAYLLRQEQAIMEMRRKRLALQTHRKDWSDRSLVTFLSEEEEQNRMDELRLKAQKRLIQFQNNRNQCKSMEGENKHDEELNARIPDTGNSRENGDSKVLHGTSLRAEQEINFHSSYGNGVMGKEHQHPEMSTDMAADEALNPSVLVSAPVANVDSIDDVATVDGDEGHSPTSANIEAVGAPDDETVDRLQARPDNGQEQSLATSTVNDGAISSNEGEGFLERHKAKANKRNAADEIASGRSLKVEINGVVAVLLTVPVKDRWHNMKKYKRCFVGSEAVSLLVLEGCAFYRSQAVHLGRIISREFDLFEHVTGKHQFEDSGSLYRFKCSEKDLSSFHYRLSKTSLYDVGTQLLDDSDRSADEAVSLDRILRALCAVEVRDRKYRFKTYRQCFVGSEAVDLLVSSRCASSREDALFLGRKVLRKYGYFEHVTGSHDFEDCHLFYRFTDMFREDVACKRLGPPMPPQNR